MTAISERSRELVSVIGWLQQQPGVRSVIPGRYTRSRHQHKPGSCRIIEGNGERVYVRAYDKRGVMDLHVYADPSINRDRWVALLVGGKKPEVKTHEQKVPAPQPLTVEIAPAEVKPVNDHAGQTFNVTPELAAQWLERNTRNRPLRQDVVHRYAADMKAGRWMITGDAIAFDKNGVCVNGQHRLWAVIFAEVTVPMLVTFNLEPEVVRVLDDHLRRRLPDIIRLSHPGVTVTQKETAIARAMQDTSLLLQGGDKRAASARLTRQEQISFLERHSEAIHFAMRDCFNSSSKRGLSQANVLSAVARAYYTADRNRLKEFGKVVLTGMTEKREDMPAILLRNWLMGQMALAARSSADLIRRKTERALRAFLDQEPIKKLFEAPEGQVLFRLPEELPPSKRKKVSVE